MNSHALAPRFNVTKLDAARRQLRVAISLWFQGGDEVAVHTLAAAAHQVIHDINAKKGGASILFGNATWKPGFRKEAVTYLKRNMIFFKHADKDPEGITEFCPMLSELFIMASLQGIESLGLQYESAEKAYHHWFCLKNPNVLKKRGSDK